MASLAEKISKLTSHSSSFDPEDEFNNERMLQSISALPIESEDLLVSDLRRKNAPLLEDVDPSYSGRKVSRKSLSRAFHVEKPENADNIYEDAVKSSESEISSNDAESFDDDEDSNDINHFKSLLSQNLNSEKNDDSERGGAEEDSSSTDLDSEVEDKVDLSEQFSSFDIASEIEKGNAIKNQKELWNRLLEGRIKLQKLLIIANKLPQSPSWKGLEKYPELVESISKSSESLTKLRNKLFELNTELIDKNVELKQASVNFVQSNDLESNEMVGSKQKRKLDDIPYSLEKRFKLLIPYRNSVIHKFDEKTKLSAGRMTQKSFNAFDNSALKQIEKILQDRTRLIKRTQLKRSLYRVLGKLEIPMEVNNEALSTNQNLLLKDYDPEIFDDDDFYRQLLKDVIESKSFGIDPTLIQKQMEIQKIRNKMKRKVDTKASKGRKLRYDVHPKMVNFCAKLQVSSMPEDSRNNILKSLFV